MNTRSLAVGCFNLLQMLLQVNFNASAIFVLIVSVLSLSGSELFFDNSADLYGPLANNLRFVLFYLCLIQVAVYGFYQTSRNYGAVLILGVFLLLLTFSLEFYAVINQIEIDQNYSRLFLYAGLSHSVYGGLAIFRNKAVS